MPYFAVWRRRIRGGGSWVETSAGYSSRSEAESVSPECGGVPELNSQTRVIEAASEAEARAIFRQWEDRERTTLQ